MSSLKISNYSAVCTVYSSTVKIKQKPPENHASQSTQAGAHFNDLLLGMQSDKSETREIKLFSKLMTVSIKQS